MLMFTNTVFPVVMREGQRAVITDDFYKTATPFHRQHLGVDIMFPRKPSDIATLPVNSVGGSKLFVMPTGIDVVAFADGKLWAAGYSETFGHWVKIDHGPLPFVTFYQHLATLAVPKRAGSGGGPLIRAGQRLGTVGGAPTGTKLRHLHFEVWNPTRDKAIDPAPLLANARHIGSALLYQLLPVVLLALGAILASRFVVA